MHFSTLRVSMRSWRLQVTNFFASIVLEIVFWTPVQKRQLVFPNKSECRAKDLDCFREENYDVPEVLPFSWSSPIFMKFSHFYELPFSWTSPIFMNSHFHEVLPFSWSSPIFMKFSHFHEVLPYSWTPIFMNFSRFHEILRTVNN
jgi:hypothetical protein